MNPQEAQTTYIPASPRSSWVRGACALLAAAGMVVVLFSILAWTQGADPAAQLNEPPRRVQLATPPPPPPPPPELAKMDQAAAPIQGAPTETQPVQPLALNPVQVDLTPGVGGTAGMLALPQFRLQTDAAAEMKSFALGDLDRIPQRLNQPQPNYPMRLRREGITGNVKLVVAIDAQGFVRFEKVLQASHNDFIEPAIELVEKLRYEPPTVNGQPVQTKNFTINIPFKLE